MGEGGAYRLDDLGWLQFERLCALVLGVEAGCHDVAWQGAADEGRVGLVDGAIALGGAPRLPGPVAVAVVWVHAGLRRSLPLPLLAGLQAVPRWFGSWCESLLVLTNADVGELPADWRAHNPQIKHCVVLGASALSTSLDRHPEVRIALPAVLGLRNLEPLLDGAARERSTLDVAAAAALARVFWPTVAYQRARAVLAQHGFVVLTGPPEMGKTAIARMLSLALLTDGWEAFECTSPDQFWASFDAERRQVFVCDDAFGSTEYQPDSAERWARELGRILAVLDRRHWLIWTSRPAPLKAGLRRVQRERGSERLPAPGEVLVDAGTLDLAEKTLILFRHAKQRGVGPGLRRALRWGATEIVGHTHFTPERIRRLIAEQGEDPILAKDDVNGWVRGIVEHELARPTVAMAHSFQALDPEYRELLIALLDVPAGLIHERELAAAARRHHTGGLSRPPTELIDRLTDHFLRVTPLGIGWVHPSWRDLVIDALRQDPRAREHFLRVCGLHGALLALSHAGGATGARALPLLVTDADWDLLGDRLVQMLGELDDHALAGLLAGLEDALHAPLEAAGIRELDYLAQSILSAARRHWDRQARPLAVFVLEAWLRLRQRVSEPVGLPSLERTWVALAPAAPLLTPVTAQALRRLDEWLALAQLLARHDPESLEALKFGERDAHLLGYAAVSLSQVTNPDLRALCESVLDRITELAPVYAPAARASAHQLAEHTADSRWWVPEDIAAPPSTEPVAQVRGAFSTEDIHRVLRDL